MEFDIELAAPQDDPAIRRLLATSAMPGDITVTFEREPDYFLGCGTMGHFCQVIVARHRPSGDIAGLACRAGGPRFVNGQVQALGYLGQIRIAEKYRGLWLISRGLAFLRELDADERVPAYFGVISDDNTIARGVFVDHPRRHFPTLREAARLYTLGIILRKSNPSPRSAGSELEIRRGSREQLGAIVAFFRQHGAARQFFPAYVEDDFVASPTTRGFDVGDFVVAHRGGEIAGVMGLWDQSGYKQTVVQSFNGALRWLRPVYNAGARLAGAQPLAAPGQHIHSAYASFICVANHDPRVFRGLLRQVCAMAAGRGYAHLMLGLAEQDPLLPAARAYPHIAYHSRLYLAYWEKGKALVEQLDGRVPYIEIAAL